MSTFKVLLVDDEVEIIDSYMKYLQKKLPEAEFNMAHSGNDAAQLHDENCYDVIISDVRMPNGDGSFLLGHVAKHPQHPKPVFIFMSGFSDVPLEELKAAGANAILEKPVRLKVLLQTVQDLMPKAKSA